MRCEVGIGTDKLLRTIDTRFFLTYLHADNDLLRRKVRSKMNELRGEGAVLPTIVIHEVYKFEHQKFGREVADNEWRSIEAAGFRIVGLNVGIAKASAILRCGQDDLPTADSIIAATAIDQNASRVVSDGEHFAKIKAIKTEWL